MIPGIVAGRPVPAARAEQFVVFTDVGEHEWSVPAGVSSVDVLLVAGGGGGGARQGGGGGAGGVRSIPSVSVTPETTVMVKVGAGGSGGSASHGSSGEDSEFGAEVAKGGGGGGGRNGTAQGSIGGSGGGGANNGAGGAGIAGQGNAGGASAPFVGSNMGGGGGGAGAAGSNGTGSSAAVGDGGDGGAGVTLASLGWAAAIPLGAPSTVGGGGGGGAGPDANSAGSGGTGGGGDGGFGTGTPPQNGTANTGGGGGGAGGSSAEPGTGGHGGSGLVVVRYHGTTPIVPTIESANAITVDSDLTVRYSKASGEAVLVASMSKLMTARVMRNWVGDANLDTTVTVLSGDLIGGSTANLQNGDVITYRDLTYAMFVPSGNDAARAIARNVGQLIIDGGGPGTSNTPLTRFIEAMNAEAVALGFSEATFVGATGISSESNKMTAAEVAELLLLCAEDAFLRDAMATLSYELTITGANARSYEVSNPFDPEGAIPFPEFVGFKTGSTTAAGYCVAFLWQTPDEGLRATVTINAVSAAVRWANVRALIDYDLSLGE